MVPKLGFSLKVRPHILSFAAAGNGGFGRECRGTRRLHSRAVTSRGPPHACGDVDQTCAPARARAINWAAPRALFLAAEQSRGAQVK